MITERYHGAEATPRERLPYAAVPLNPWKATHPETAEPYYNTSLSRITHLADMAIVRAMEDGRIQDPDIAKAVHELVSGSLLDAHTRRVLYHAEVNLDEHDHQGDELFELAKDGLATPEELYRLLKNNLSLGSVELAKLTHPFDFAATDDMDLAVFDVIAEHDGYLVNKEPTYKVKRCQPDLPAAVLVRKQVLGAEAIDEGVIEIVERRSLLVRGDDEAKPEVPYIDRLIRNPNRRDELIERIEVQLKDVSDQITWLQPTTSSYYARFIKNAD